MGNLDLYDRHGWQVELDGDRLAVTSRADDAASLNSGSVSIFQRRQDGVFAFCQKIALPSSATGLAYIGTRLLMYDDWLFVSAFNYTVSGAPCNGALLAYRWVGGCYAHHQTLAPPSGSQYCAFGSHCDFDGEYLFVGASIDAEFGFNHGSLYRYCLRGGIFELQHRFYDTNLSYIGQGLKLTGDGRLLAGGNSKVALLSGVYSSNWVVEEVIYGESVLAEDIEIYGDEILIGSPRFGTSLIKGAVAILDLHPVGMSFREFLYAPGQTVGSNVGDDFGSTFEIQGDWLFVGAHAAFDPAQNAVTGAAFVFERVGNTWEPRYRLLSAPGMGNFDGMGKGITVDGSRLIVGAPYTFVNGLAQVGLSYVFEIGFGNTVCTPLTPNSLGETPRLRAYGSNNAAMQDLELRTEGVPGNGLAVLLAASTASAGMPMAHGDGQLCLGSQVRRLALGQVSMGVARFPISWQHPLISSTAWLDAGTTTYFQAWYRDSNPQPTSNLTGAVAVLME
ncbi:FG-GAP repeat protein [Planctomycetes bacterium Poly30]|uniref:FG-GAP repeat protein n=1 Tax=Saltatorellus ferox TaxID=2528018 RepID=UPI0011A797D5